MVRCTMGHINKGVMGVESVNLKVYLLKILKYIIFSI